MIVEQSRPPLRRATYELRRLAQTPKAFANWSELLSGIARDKVAEGPEELTFHARNGATIFIPNAPGARVPVYEVFAEDCYDLAWFLDDLVAEPIHVVDIGAHVGTFSTALAALNPKAVIDSFEPSPDTYQYLVRNVAANGNRQRITPHQKAVAGRTGQLTFDLQGAGSGHNHVAFEGRIDGSGVTVEAISFDDIVAATSPVTVIKMDCEGGEYDLVYNSSKENWASVQRLVLEYHEMPGESWEELRAWFASVGLHVLRDDRSRIAGTAWLSRTPIRDHDGKGPRSLPSKVGYAVRRVAQTPATFENWGELLSGLVREKVGSGPAELTFETRSGQRITSPNVPGARLPAYEQFAEDGYRLDWFLKGLDADAPVHGFDVGAHVGTFACRFADVLPTATMTCFEPAPETARYLRRNVEQNGLGDRIGVVEAALAGETGTAVFEDHGGASVHSGLAEAHPVDDPHAAGTGISVATLSFDDAVAAAPGPVRFVKLDCEGGEYQLCYQSSPQSWADVERVVLEYHDVPGESWAELRAWFAGVGLHLVAHRPERADLGLAWLARGAVSPFPG